MAMVISPRSKIVTLTLLIGIIIVVALIVVGALSVWSNKPPPEQRPVVLAGGHDTMSSRLQQFTSYTAKQVSGRRYLEPYTHTLVHS